VHRLQTRFFIDGVDVGNETVLINEAVAAGADEVRFVAALRSPATLQRVRAGFELAKAFGTSALPSVHVDVAGTRGLVAGGYVDAPTLLESVRGHLRRMAET
jgi:predicted DsbA family dithiol-disulfide isomerase